MRLGRAVVAPHLQQGSQPIVFRDPAETAAGEFQALTPHEAAAGDHSGAAVRWGGRIIRTEPRPDRTCFEVISTRLNADGRPYWASDDTWGRFIACRTGFYDPALFQPAEV